MKMVIMMLGITARIPIADSIDGERVTYHPHSARHGGAGRAGGPTPCVLVPPNLRPPRALSRHFRSYHAVPTSRTADDALAPLGQ